MAGAQSNSSSGPQAANLASLVAYQEGSIVSREIVKRPSGSVTLFAFDRDQRLSEHTAPFDAMVQVVEGSARVRIGGRESVVRAGEFIIMPANVPHAVDAVERFKMMLVMIRS